MRKIKFDENCEIPTYETMKLTILYLLSLIETMCRKGCNHDLNKKKKKKEKTLHNMARKKIKILLYIFSEAKPT